VHAIPEHRAIVSIEPNLRSGAAEILPSSALPEATSQPLDVVVQPMSMMLGSCFSEENLFQVTNEVSVNV